MIPSISENYKYSEFFPPFPFTFSNSSSFFSPTSIHFVYIYYNLLNPLLLNRLLYLRFCIYYKSNQLLIITTTHIISIQDECHEPKEKAL